MRAWMLLTLAAVLLTACATPAKRQQAREQVDFHYRMGLAYLEDSDFQNGLVEFRAAQAINADSPKVLFAMGHTYFVQGDYDQAQTMMEHLIVEQPNNGKALNYLGNILEKKGDNDGALAAFKKATAVLSYRTPHYSLQNEGRIYLKRGEPTQAEEAFKEAIKRVPTYYSVRADLAKLYLDDGRWAEAADQWRAYLDLQPEGVEAHYYLGQAYKGLGQDDRAKAALRTFIDAAGPDHPLTPEAEALLDEWEPR